MICSETEDHKNAVEAFVKKEKVDFRGNSLLFFCFFLIASLCSA